MSAPAPSAFLSASPSDALAEVFGHRHRAKRYAAILADFAAAGAVTVAAATRTEAARHGAYRFLHNPAVTPELLAAAARERTRARAHTRAPRRRGRGPRPDRPPRGPLRGLPRGRARRARHVPTPGRARGLGRRRRRARGRPAARRPRVLRTGAAWPADAAPAPIHWRLYGSRVPGDRAAAARMVRYDAYRWRVACLFATGKSRGFGAEGTQSRSGRALQNAAVTAMTAAAERVGRLCGARDGSDVAPAHEVLGYEVLGYDDAAFLEAANARVETAGTTVVNPHPPGTVSYVSWVVGRGSWVVARFGSWTGLPSEGPCGSRRMARGYVRLAEFRAGYLAAMARPPDPGQESGQ